MAVDADDLAVDEAGGVGAQEHDGGCDAGRIHERAHRHLLGVAAAHGGDGGASGGGLGGDHPVHSFAVNGARHHELEYAIKLLE